MILTVRRSCLYALLTATLFLANPVTSTLRAQNAPMPDASMTFDVRNGDQVGKLMVKDSELSFESLTDAKHSHMWRYADLRELSRKRKSLSVQPYHGDRYDFQLKNNDIRDKIYDLISQRILAARQAPK